MEEFLKRTWADIDLDAIEHNYHVIRDAVKSETMICCIIKADAYGHGAVMLAHEYERLGADWFAVSNIEEATQLRTNGISTPILILGYTPPEMAYELASNNISQSILSIDYAKKLSDCAAKSNVSVKVHIKVDTGMSRIGFMYQSPMRDGKSIDEMADACRLPNLLPEGIFTHFAVADEGEDGENFTKEQFDDFIDAVSKLEHLGIKFKIRHCSNSAAIFDYPEYYLDMVRPGVILYGLEPSSKIENPHDLVPAMELKTVISLIKTVEPCSSVSYGRTYITEKPTKIATLPIGYADGYLRAYSGRADVIVNGKRAPIIGRVCMDQLMIDVTDCTGINEGDTVTVFGKDKGEYLSIDELANMAGTINYELICILGKRVPRIYKRGGKTVGYLNYICP